MMRAVATPDLHALASRVRAASRGPPRCLRDHVAAVEARERAGAGVHREEARNDAAVRLCVHFAPRRQAASSSDGRRAAVTNSDRSGRVSASNDGVIHVFDLATGAHPAGKLLISGGHRGFQVSDLKLRVWNLGTRKCERTITHAKMPGAFTPLSLALDPRTDTIARLERLERTRSRACVENPAYGGVSSAAKTSSASFGGEQPRVPCGIVLWPAAIALAHEIASRQVAGMRVLELGAGTGLPGIVAASLGAHVVQTDKQELALFVCKKNAERNGVTTIQHRAADWTAWEDREAYDLIIGADVLYADTMHPHLRAIFERNLAPGGTILLSDPFRKESLALLEAMETSGWKVTMNKWTVGITPPERPVGVFELTLPA